MKDTGAKSRAAQPLRDKVISFRLSEKEYAVLDGLARKAGMKPADYTRRAVLREGRPALPPGQEPSEALLQVIDGLTQIGLHLDQIARVTRDTGTQPLPVVFDLLLTDLSVVVGEARRLIARRESDGENPGRRRQAQAAEANERQGSFPGLEPSCPPALSMRERDPG